MSSISIRQLMQIHEAITKAMDAMDRALMDDSGESWRELNKARSVVRVTIERSGVKFVVQEAA
jgi:hypothetical protein